MIGRHLFQSIDNRILFGITTFMITMVLLGWVAINELPRMRAFEEQFLARSIENGASLFVANCTRCHGETGLGIAGYAPALNNPQLFGYDYMAELDAQIAQLHAEEKEMLLDIAVLGRDVTTVTAQIASWEAELSGLEQNSEDARELDAQIAAYKERLALDAELASQRLEFAQQRIGSDLLWSKIRILTEENSKREVLLAEQTLIEGQLAAEGEEAATQEEKNTLSQRLAEIQADIAALPDRSQELATLQASYDSGLAELRELESSGGDEEEINILRRALGLDTISAELAEKQSAREALLTEMTLAIARGYDPDRPDRLVNVEWGDTLHSFIFSSVEGGRPVSIAYWGDEQQMPTWSDKFGGPFRDDQITDLTNFILNYDREWTMGDLLAVNQFSLEPGQDGGGAADVETVGSDVQLALASIADLNGDVARGELLYEGQTPTEALVVLGCASCHQAGNAPETAGTWTRVLEQRLTEPQFIDYSPERYVVESILQVDAYEAPGSWAVVMPSGFSNQLTAQDLADLLAFIQTQE